MSPPSVGVVRNYWLCICINFFFFFLNAFSMRSSLDLQYILPSRKDVHCTVFTFLSIRYTLFILHLESIYSEHYILRQLAFEEPLDRMCPWQSDKERQNSCLVLGTRICDLYCSLNSFCSISSQRSLFASPFSLFSICGVNILRTVWSFLYLSCRYLSRRRNTGSRKT